MIMFFLFLVGCPNDNLLAPRFSLHMSNFNYIDKMITGFIWIIVFSGKKIRSRSRQIE